MIGIVRKGKNYIHRKQSGDYPHRVAS